MLSIMKRNVEEEDDDDDDDENVENGYNEGRVLRDTAILYGSLMILILVAFGCVRKRYPKAFNIRNWVEELQTPLAQQQYGGFFFSWLWHIYSDVSEEQILNECGMDAVCFVRLLQMGFRLR